MHRTAIVVGLVVAVFAHPQMAGAAPAHHSSPFDGAYLAQSADDAEATIAVCNSDSGGSVAADVVAGAIVGESTPAYAWCHAGALVTNVHVPGNRDWDWGPPYPQSEYADRHVSVSATFHIETATVEAPIGANVDIPIGGSPSWAIVAPCIAIGNDLECNWGGDDNGVFTRRSGPLATGSRDAATDETWTVREQFGLPQGEYEVRAFLITEAFQSSLAGPGATAKVVGTVESITVDTNFVEW